MKTVRLPPVRYASKLHKLENVRFSGMDRRKSRSDGGIADMLNINMDEYPSLQTRDCRGKLETDADSVLYYDASDSTIVISGKNTNALLPLWESGTVYSVGDKVRYKSSIYECVNAYNGSATPLGDRTHWKIIDKLNGNANEEYEYADLSIDGKPKNMYLALTDDPKEVGILNDIAIVMPDKKYYKIEDDESGWLWENHNTEFDSDTIKNEITYSSGETFKIDSLYVLVAEKGGNTLKLDTRYSSKSLPIEYTNFRISDYIKPNDVISISISGSVTTDGNVDKGCVLLTTKDRKYVVKEVTDSSITLDGDPFADAIYSESADGEYGNRNKNYIAGKRIIITKDTVDFQHMCIAKNRMWACKDDSIFCSGLGDCLSWTNYSGLETDPWTTDTGSSGEFTACYEYGGTPIFFKRDSAYAVYGDYYSNFAAQKIMDRGVREDSHKSVCVVNSSLMWLSDNGVCAYSGGVPAIVSTALCEELSEGVASTDGFKYYLSASNGEKRRLYIYDTRYSTWTSEDLDEKPAGMSKSEDSLSYMSHDGTIYFLKEFGNVVYKTDEQFESYIEFKDFYEQSMDKKDIGRILIRAGAEPEGGGIDIKIMYDSDGEWHKAGRIFNQTNAKKVSEFAFFPRRCDHWRLRLESKGKFILYGIGRKVRI